MGSERPVTRRRYGADMKARVLAECDEPGTSVAKIAMAHGINANVVHRWRQLARESTATIKPKGSEFVAVTLPPQPAQTQASDVQIQLRRGTTALTITWPIAAATEFAAWMRELLR
jgi:transposase